MVGSMKCAVTRRSEVTLHHCHGGSLIEEFPELKKKGGRKTSDWLVIPLAAELHVGRLGIDGSMGVRSWEKRFGRQTDMLRKVSAEVGYDVIELALEEQRNAVWTPDQ